MFPTAQTVLQAIYGVQTQSNLNTYTCNTTASRILDQNNYRVAYIIINSSAVNVYVWFDQTVSTTKGILIPANGGTMNLSLREDFSLPTNELWIIPDSGTPTIDKLEVLIG